jgi:2-oxoglutarate ferredoxin oxidoreductase subunit beta
MHEPWLHDPKRILMLHHEQGLQLSAGLAKTYPNQLAHDPLNIHRAREIASGSDPIPVGILYNNPEVPCYEETRHAGQLRTTDYVKAGLDAEFDKFTVWPQDAVRPSA